MPKLDNIAPEFYRWWDQAYRRGDSVMGWTQQLAKQLSKHSDSLAVIRSGKKAKRRTRRHDRQKAKQDIRESRS